MPKIIIAGDYAPKFRISEKVEAGDYIFFDEIRPLIASADYSIVNFECPVVNGDYAPLEKYGPNLRTSRKAVDALKYAGFNLATLANNHVLDYGGGGLCDTIGACQDAGIDFVGAGESLKEASKTRFLKVKDKVIAVVNCCEHEFSIATEDAAGANPLNPVQQYYAITEARLKADYVMVIVHGGHEMCQLPSPRMIETYHFFIDAGADAVINHHQHCFSGYEVYKGKPVFYGLGNFCFDSQTHRTGIWNYGYMVELSLSDMRFKLHPYHQCGDNGLVSLLQGDELSAFEKQIKELNEVIANPSELKREYDDWVRRSSAYFGNVLSPFTNKYLCALQSRGLWPRCISRLRELRLLNYVDCESHRDRLLAVLKKYK